MFQAKTLLCILIASSMSALGMIRKTKDALYYPSLKALIDCTIARGDKMRILGVSKKWDKLQQEEFTTFRYPRKDKDWQIGELVQIVYKPRSKEREILGTASIVSKEPKPSFLYVTFREAINDGFPNLNAMENWLIKTHGLEKCNRESMNKLTLRWIAR